MPITSNIVPKNSYGYPGGIFGALRQPGGLIGGIGRDLGGIARGVSSGIGSALLNFGSGLGQGLTGASPYKDAPTPTAIANFNPNDPKTFGPSVSTPNTSPAKPGTTKPATNNSTPTTSSNQPARQAIPGYVPGVGQVPDISKYGSAGVAGTPSTTPTPAPTSNYQIQNTPFTAQANGQPYSQYGSTPGVFGTAIGQSLGIGMGGGQQPVSQPINYLMGQTQGPTPAQQDIQTLRQFSQTPSPQVTQAQDAYNQLAQSAPYAIAAQYNPNVAADIASGRASLLGQTFAQELNARQQAVTNALAGQQQQIGAATQAAGQALTGQQQQIGAAEQGGQLGLGGQGQAVSALGQAISGAAPRQQGYVLIDPATGQPVGGAGGASGAAFAGGQIGQQESLGGTYTTYQTAQRQAQALGSQLTNVIGQYGINPSDINAVNKFIQAWSANTSNPQYQTFNNLINDLANRYAQVLTPAGGNVTDMVRSIVSGFINASSSGQSIQQVLNALDNQASAVINSIPQGTQGTQGTQGGGAATPQSGGTTNDPLGIL